MIKLIKLIVNLFCNIDPFYYFWNFIVGVAISCLIILAAGNSHPQIIITNIICTLFYPYSRFVYKTIIDFTTDDEVVRGDKVVVTDKVIIVNKVIVTDIDSELVNDIIGLFFKMIGIALCFYLSPFIAPIGLLMLYLQKKNVKTEIE